MGSVLMSREGDNALTDWLGLGHTSSTEIGETELTVLEVHGLRSGRGGSSEER